ncbi:Uncharacterised protein [Mycobacteroides abscessus subsp. massiliense]|nr:Uncharacterised protein [Mycobacteroides abscessus subsp. massiliense]
MPAEPMAASVWPLRQARPMVSVITTATLTPKRCDSASRTAAALASGSVGSRTSSALSTFDASIPAAACTMPMVFSVISVLPLRASTRIDSESINLRRSVSRASGSVGAATIRPSALEIILLVMTITSPSRSHGAAPAMAVATSSPGRNSGRPVTGKI